jgi:general secretion pathway protein E
MSQLSTDFMNNRVGNFSSVDQSILHMDRGEFCAFLVETGKINQADADRAMRLFSDQAGQASLISLIIKLGLLSDKDLAAAISSFTNLPIIEKKEYPDELIESERVSLKFLKENKVLLLDEDQDYLVTAIADPFEKYVFDALDLITEKKIIVKIGVLSEIEQSLESLLTDSLDGKSKSDYSASTNAAILKDDVEQLKEMASEAPVIKRVNQILQKAAVNNASDIHIEPFENLLRVRFRVDGMLRDEDSPPSQDTAAIISRIKIMANLNIAERRLPQDGRFKVRIHGDTIDLRVSTLPTLHGESVVLRLLRRNDLELDFGFLGIEEGLTKQILHVLEIPHGIILVTGPTGSGKTTTLYAALNHLNRPDRKIITVEDPVEYNIEGVNQIQVKADIGLTFANALRSIVRQDPDIIMIGEMRDQETAKIAVQSALTGHLVLSAIHTNDAVSSITRLLDMGVESYLIASTVNAIMAQRLVRKLCSKCKQPYTPTDEEISKLGLDKYFTASNRTIYQAAGCEECGHTGYSGRSAIIELLLISHEIKKLISTNADEEEIYRTARKENLHTMYEDGVRKVAEGITTIQEVLRITQEK